MVFARWINLFRNKVGIECFCDVSKVAIVVFKFITHLEILPGTGGFGKKNVVIFLLVTWFIKTLYLLIIRQLILRSILIRQKGYLYYR